jgi:segregation and condensation protein B
MSSSLDPPFESQPQGISLDELAEAFAQVMGVEPRRATDSQDATKTVSATIQPTDLPTPPAETPTPEPIAEDDTCPISPRSILEAMLFVGNRDNRPLTPARAAELMRDVSADEIPSLVEDLNRRYAACGAACQIVGEGDGYRLTLCDTFRPLRNRFYGRIRQARLSQAAIDVLALVAYQQPITSEKIGRLRGKPSSHVLAHLVRRGLLRIERPETKRRVPHYHTTDRFLKLFNLQSLDDLPHSEDASLP